LLSHSFLLILLVLLGPSLALAESRGNKGELTTEFINQGNNTFQLKHLLLSKTEPEISSFSQKAQDSPLPIGHLLRNKEGKEIIQIISILGSGGLSRVYEVEVLETKEKLV
jgi:hypothetical protein